MWTHQSYPQTLVPSRSGHLLASPSGANGVHHLSRLFKLFPLTALVPEPPLANAPKTPTALLPCSHPYSTLSSLSWAPEGRASHGVAFSAYQAALQAMMRSGKREVDVSMMGGRGSRKERAPEGGWRDSSPS